MQKSVFAALFLIIEQVHEYFNSSYIPSGMISSIVRVFFGFSIPCHCLWQAHKSKNRPMGMSQNSSAPIPI